MPDIAHMKGGEMQMTTGKEDIYVAVTYTGMEDESYSLAKMIGSLHGDMVGQYIRKLKCSSKDKERLLERVIDLSARG